MNQTTIPFSSKSPLFAFFRGFSSKHPRVSINDNDGIEEATSQAGIARRERLIFLRLVLLRHPK